MIFFNQRTFSILALLCVSPLVTLNTVSADDVTAKDHTIVSSSGARAEIRLIRPTRSIEVRFLKTKFDPPRSIELSFLGNDGKRTSVELSVMQKDSKRGWNYSGLAPETEQSLIGAELKLRFGKRTQILK